MSKQDKKSEYELNEVNSQIKLITIVFLILASIITLLCLGLLLQGYLTNHIAYEELIFEVLNIKFGIHEFYSFCFKLIGYLLLITIIIISSILKINKDKKMYYLLFVAIIFLLFSFMELVYITKFELNYWQYIYIILLHILSLSIVFIKYFLIREELANIIGLIAILTITLSSLIN